MPPPEEHIQTEAPELARVMGRNIEALLARRKEQERVLGVQDRVVDAVAHFLGSLWSLYLHLLVYGGWVAINAGWIPLPRFDPSFLGLGTTAAVEAIFLSTLVLITQNRMSAEAEARADLDLQTNLLAEHEATRVLRLVAAIAERMGIEEAQDPEIRELEQDVEPEQVLDHMETLQQDAPPDPDA
jgi:uncharacterized membrane protein